jgi:hypothetical protein
MHEHFPGGRHQVPFVTLRDHQTMVSAHFLCKPRRLAPLGDVRLDQSLAADLLRDVAGQLAEVSLNPFAGAAHARVEYDEDQRIQRENQHACQGQLPADGSEQRDGERQLQRVEARHDDPGVDERRGIAHVVEHARQDVSSALLRVKLQAELLQVPEQVTADVGDDRVTEMHVEVSSPVHDGGMHHGGRERELGQPEQALLTSWRGARRRRGGDDEIHDRTDDPRIDEGEQEPHHPERRGEQRVSAVVPDISQQLQERTF